MSEDKLKKIDRLLDKYYGKVNDSFTEAEVARKIVDETTWLIKYAKEQAEQIHEFNNMLKEIGHALDDYENTGTWSEEETLTRIASVFKTKEILT